MDTRKVRANTIQRVIFGILFIVVALLMALSCFGAFSKVGSSLKQFWTGTFGLAAYGYAFALLILGVTLVFNIRRKRSIKNLLKHISLFVVAIWALHIYTSSPEMVGNGYGGYLRDTYYAGSTAGGVLFGIPSWPLMKVITPVGALIVVCIGFFTMLFFAYIFPYLRHNVTYSSSSKEGNKKQKKEKIDLTSSPTITSFGSNGSQSIALDVAGADSRLADKNAVGADGYTPMRTTSVNILNESLQGYEQSKLEGGYETQQDLARDILFGDDPSPDLMDRYRIAGDPNLALNDIGASYGAVKKSDFREKLGWNEEAQRQEFISRYTDEPARDVPNYTLDDVMAASKREEEERRKRNEENTNSAMPSFFDLKAEQAKLFRELNTPKPEEPQNTVVQPTHKMETPDINAEKQMAQDTTATSGLRGAVNRAAKGEDIKPKVEENVEKEVEAEAYVEPTTPKISMPAQPPQQEKVQQTVYPQQPQQEQVINYFTNPQGNRVLQEQANKEVAPQPIQQAQPTPPPQPPQQQVVVQPVQPIYIQQPVQPVYVQQPVQQVPPQQPVQQPVQQLWPPVPQQPVQQPAQPVAKPVERSSILDRPVGYTDIERQLIEAEKEEKRKKESIKDKRFEKAVKEMEKIGKEELAKAPKPVQISMEQVKPKKPMRPYKRPPISLLDPPRPAEQQDEDYDEMSRRIEEKFNFFRIQCKVVGTTTGPTFTLYTCDVQMPKGKSVKTILSYETDLAMCMEKESVRILAPIPGTNYVGIEVPNKKRSIVTFSEIVNSQEFKAKGPYAIGVGKDLYGKIHVYDFPKFPHILIAGQTGAGKSCCIGILLCSLLYKATPEELRLILIDPKRTEFGAYNGIPHLLTDEVICDVDKAIRSLNWAVNEMVRRMQFLQDNHCRDVDEYNKKAEDAGLQKLPKILIVVDELADLMQLGQKAVEDAINRIARLARAMGIHMVLATQRPSVDVISGTIKNNLPTRIACKVTSIQDSRTVLDSMGAEKLLGMGDLLYRDPTMANPARIQGGFISNDEVSRIVDFVKQNNDTDFDQSIKDAIWNEEKEDAGDKDSSNKKKDNPNALDEDVIEALRIALESEEGLSISMIQRRSGFGWPRAAKAFDKAQQLGIFGPKDNKSRIKLVISAAEVEEMIRKAESGEDEDGDEE
ncbi:MAG: hypothetical protein J5656_04795 [Clostridia bacterium]|nr:hypothetical protein [Clostridia bacterium]